MGQDIYGLVILDFIMTILDFFFTDFLRSVTVKLVMIKILKVKRIERITTRPYCLLDFAMRLSSSFKS